MHILIAEDEITSRTIIQEFLEPYGRCDIAVNGKEAIDAFRISHDTGNPYNLVVLDLMMPEVDGQRVLKDIRKLEAEKGITANDAAKVIITTCVSDRKNIMEAFRSQAESYLIKPIEKDKLLEQLRSLSLID